MQFNIVISETLFIPILICQILFLEINGLHISYNVGFNTECVDDKLAFLQIIQIALDQCVVECARRKKCRGISYRERFTLCNLIDVDNPPYLSSTPADCVLVNKNHMKYQLPQTCKDCENCDIDTGQCIITECHKLTLNDGTLLGNMNSIGNRVKYTCNPGFKREKDEAYATCQQNGYWSLTPRCVIDIVVCENGNMKLSCPAGNKIYINSANYGRTQGSSVCPSNMKTTDCRLTASLEKVRSECNGKDQCHVPATNTFFGTDPCVGTTKYLEVAYTCA